MEKFKQDTLHSSTTIYTRPDGKFTRFTVPPQDGIKVTYKNEDMIMVLADTDVPSWVIELACYNDKIEEVLLPEENFGVHSYNLLRSGGSILYVMPNSPFIRLSEQPNGSMLTTVLTDTLVGIRKLKSTLGDEWDQFDEDYRTGLSASIRQITAANRLKFHPPVLTWERLVESFEFLALRDIDRWEDKSVKGLQTISTEDVLQLALFGARLFN